MTEPTPTDAAPREESVERDHLHVTQIGENAYRIAITCPRCGTHTPVTPEVFNGEQPFVCFRSETCDFSTQEDFRHMLEPLDEPAADEQKPDEKGFDRAGLA